MRAICSPLLKFSSWLFLFIGVLVSFSVTSSFDGYKYGVKSGYSKSESSISKSYASYKDLVKVYEARNVEFGFPSRKDRVAAIKNGLYNPDAPIPIDADVYYPSNGAAPRIFITIPRFRQGIPYSLGYLTNVKKLNGTEIQPYPSYEWHSSHGKNCDGLQSVYRIFIDECGQMWILDSGEIEFVQYCPPQIVVIDLITNQMIHRYRLPESQYKSGVSRFVTPIVDIADPPPTGTCREAIVYMADPTGNGIVVYDVVRDISWRIENKYTYPDPDFSNHTIDGESFELLDGVFTFALTPRSLGIKRHLYFHSLASDLEVAAPLDVINNPSNWVGGISSSLKTFIPLGRRGVQCAASAMTSNGTLICGFLKPIALFGWNIQKSYNLKNLIPLVENTTSLQFVSGLKIVKNAKGNEEVWIVSNRLQKFFSGTMNYKEINYRIQKCGVVELMSGARCT